MAMKKQVRCLRVADYWPLHKRTALTDFASNFCHHAGEVVVNFLVPPSKKGMKLLKNELGRLDKFGKQLEQLSKGDVPEYELTSLLEYYDALRSALHYTLESNVTIVDDVWSMDDGWWVKDGPLKAENVDEHCVRPSKLHDNEEL